MDYTFFDTNRWAWDIDFYQFIRTHFSGNSTFQNQMFIQNMLNVENMGDAFKSLVRIIVITLVIEFVGGVFIFFTTSSDLFGSGGSHAFLQYFILSVHFATQVSRHLAMTICTIQLLDMLMDFS